MDKLSIQLVEITSDDNGTMVALKIESEISPKYMLAVIEALRDVAEKMEEEMKDFHRFRTAIILEEALKALHKSQS